MMTTPSAKPLVGVKFSLVPLGCAKNLVDSERLLYCLLEAGAQLEDDPLEAEVVIVNTCGFIQSAQQESLEALQEALDLKREGTIQGVVCAGCLSQRFADELAESLPELQVMLGIDPGDKIIPAVQAVLAHKPYLDVPPVEKTPLTCAPRTLTTPPWYAYLKVSDGCDNWCSYCAIPLIRGPNRSAPVADLIEEARRLTNSGVRELNLIAQDLGRYGTDLRPASNLLELIQAICDNCGPELHWLRLLYLHPAHLPEGLLGLMSIEPRVVPYLDVPFQHASASVLSRMNRSGSASEQLELVQRIRAEVPDVTLRTTCLVGFPGESELDFAELLDFIEQARFDRLTTFAYSPEEGTAAFVLDNRVPEEIAQERLEAVFELQRNISAQLNEAFVGRTLEVLIEERQPNGWYSGRSWRDAPEVDCQVLVRGPNLQPGQFRQVRITSTDDYDLVGVCD